MISVQTSKIIGLIKLGAHDKKRYKLFLLCLSVTIHVVSSSLDFVAHVELLRKALVSLLFTAHHHSTGHISPKIICIFDILEVCLVDSW